MSTYHWVNAAGGNWDIAGNWNLGTVPGPLDLVFIDAPGTYVVTLTGADTARNLTVGTAGATVVNSGTLNLSGTLLISAGVFDLALGGTINGGTLVAAGGSFAWNGGTLSGVTYQGTLDLTALGASLTIANGIVVTGAGGVGPGTINANGAAASLDFIGTQTLDNVTLNIGSTSLSWDILTFGANVIINQVGNTVAGGLAYDYGNTLVNNGVWQALDANSGANLFLTSMTNNGRMDIGSGALMQVFASDSTNTGAINVTGTGSLGFYGTASVTNSGIINDGNVAALSSPAFTNSGQIFVTGADGTLQISTTGDGVPTSTMNGTGSISLSGVGSSLDFVGSEAVQQGTIDLAAANTQIWVHDLGASLVGSQLVFGAAAVINQTSGSSVIKDDGVPGDIVINNGVINAGASAGIFVVQPTAFTNNGAIHVSNTDTLLVRSALNGTGTISLSGASTAEIAGSSAAGQTFAFTDATADVLKIDSAASFASHITGFSIGNTIDLAGVTSTGATVSGGVLSVALTGGGTLNLAVSGPTAGQFVHGISDNAGGTDIVLTNSAAQPAPLPLPSTVFTPGEGATGLDVTSTSFAAIAPPAVIGVPVVSTNTASNAGVAGLLTASSLSNVADSTTGNALSVGQTLTAAWTSSYTAVATWHDTWSEVVVSQANQTNASYGSAVTFTVNLTAGGSFDLSWLALESGQQNFGMQNPYLSVDGTMMVVDSPNVFSATPIGDFIGTLSAGWHSLTLMDNSNFGGLLGTTGSTLDATFHLTITPNAIPPAASYTVQGVTLSVAEGSILAAPIAGFTDNMATDIASQFAATITWGDGTTSTGLVSGGNGVFTVTDAGGHAFADEGAFATSVSVVNTADNSTIDITSTITATEADILAVKSAPSITTAPGQAVNGTIATFTDSYVGSTAADFTASITWGDGTTSLGVVTETAGIISVAGTHAYASAGTDQVSVTLQDADGTATATANGTAIVAAPVAGTLTLTTRQDNLIGGAANDIFVARTNTISNGDVLNGGGGINTLSLSGGGSFDLTRLDKISNIQIIAAQDGAGAGAQTLTLLERTSFAVNVASDPNADPASGITIIGADNTDVITLGKGIDTITLGVGETVIGGGGTAFYKVNSNTIADTITGGATGTNTLVVSGGDTRMGLNITGMTAVQLAGRANFTANATSGMTITGSAAGGDTITLGSASQSVIGGGGGEKILASAANAGAAISGLGANSTLEITSGGVVALANTTSVTTVKLDAATNLTLSRMSFLTATGSSGADTITAGATYQTLTGGSGADTLVGFAGGFDIFSDKAAGLNGDLIQNFLASDQIDVTNMAFAGASLKAVATGANTSVTLTSGAMKTTFTLAGAYSASGFHLASDGATGTMISHI